MAEMEVEVADLTIQNRRVQRAGAALAQQHGDLQAQPSPAYSLGALRAVLFDMQSYWGRRKHHLDAIAKDG